MIRTVEKLGSGSISYSSRSFQGRHGKRQAATRIPHDRDDDHGPVLVMPRTCYGGKVSLAGRRRLRRQNGRKFVSGGIEAGPRGLRSPDEATATHGSRSITAIKKLLPVLELICARRRSF